MAQIGLAGVFKVDGEKLSLSAPIDLVYALQIGGGKIIDSWVKSYLIPSWSKEKVSLLRIAKGKGRSGNSAFRSRTVKEPVQEIEGKD